MPRDVLPLTVILPLRDPAPDAARRCLDALARLDPAPAEVLVVESHSRNPGCWEGVARHCGRLGPRFRFVSLGAWPGGREGALNLALRDAAAGSVLVGVVDVGTLPDADWLKGAEALLADPALALLAAPVAGMAPHADGLLPDGALLLARRGALRAAGGWRPGPAAEEALAPRLMRAGWEVSVADRMAGRRQGSGGPAWRAARRAMGVALAVRHHAGEVLHPRRRHFSPAQRRRLVAAWLPALGDGAARLALLGALAWSLALPLAAVPAPPALPFLAAALLPLAAGRRWGPEALAASGAAGRAMLGARDGGPAAGVTLAGLASAMAAAVLGWPAGAPGRGLWLVALALLGLPALAALARGEAAKPGPAADAAVGSGKKSLAYE